MEGSTTSCSSICEAISDQRHAHPDSTALMHGDRQLSYLELDRKANQFAGYLESLGVEQGGTVALCLGRSFEWIIAALGIMRTGAAYVPLDSAWPDSRLQYAVKDSGATIVVASAAVLERLGGDVRGVDPYAAETIEAQAVAMESSRETRVSRPESIAYVIYTSGSTGVPKGVEITHANLSHLIRWHVEAFQVKREDRASHLAGLGFDAAVWEIWPTLAAGATLCLAEDAVRSSPELIQEWMLREGVTIGFVPTVHAGALMALPWPATTTLRYLLTGGDTLHHAPPVGLPFKVVNNYGPTECTVVSTSSVVAPASEGAPAIGRAITGASVYLLDEDGRAVADGQPGEIYIGGEGVGAGYRNLQEATQRSFVADPFSGRAGARMYRSGDQGVRRADGQIEFRGRLDRQAKIRGYRIELDEIGGVLSRHAAVEFAVATVDNDGAEPRLVAYVLVKKGAGEPTASVLQEHLLVSLPQYMVPAVFIRLDKLPLSANGKIDLTLLPKLGGAPLLGRDVAKQTTTAVEGRLLSLVRELLENESVTVSDNFFLAGGHSLLGMQLVLRLRKEFGMAFNLRQLFEAPTVEGLAVVIESKLIEERLQAIWVDLLGVEKVGLDADFFELGGTATQLTSLQRRIIAEMGRRLTLTEIRERPTVRQQAELISGYVKANLTLPPGVLALQASGARSNLFWVHYPCENLAKAMGEERPFLFVTLTDEDLEKLGSGPTVQEIAACLMGKILAAQPNGPYTLGGFCIGGVLGYEIARQLRAGGHDVALLVLLDTPSPMYYEDPRLFAPRLSQPQYILRRVANLGLRASFRKVRERLRDRLPTGKEKNLQAVLDAVQDEDPAQQMIENSAALYKPAAYDGEVALLLASGHPPHVNFEPGWRALIGDGMRVEYVEGQHLELTQMPGVQRVGAAINAHLAAVDERRLVVPAKSGADR